MIDRIQERIKTDFETTGEKAVELKRPDGAKWTDFDRVFILTNEKNIGNAIDKMIGVSGDRIWRLSRKEAIYALGELDTWDDELTPEEADRLYDL